MKSSILPYGSQYLNMRLGNLRSLVNNRKGQGVFASVECRFIFSRPKADVSHIPRLVLLFMSLRLTPNLDRSSFNHLRGTGPHLSGQVLQQNAGGQTWRRQQATWLGFRSGVLPLEHYT